MRRVRAKVAHTIEPGSRYVHAGEELDIADDQFDGVVHEHLEQDELNREPNADGAVVLPQGVDTPERPKPGSVPADQQYSLPDRPKTGETETGYFPDRPAIGEQTDVATDAPAHSPSVAPIPAQPPKEFE